MELGDIKSSLLQLMKIIVSAERAVLLSDERFMYASMFQPKSKNNFASNKGVLKDLTGIIFSYLNDRRYPGKILECNLFIKGHDDLWENDKYQVTTLDPYMELDDKIASPQEKKGNINNIDANDIKIYFDCSFKIISDYLESIGLVIKEEILSTNETSAVDSRDEDSDSSIDHSDNDNDISDYSETKESNNNSSANIVYRINLSALDKLHTDLIDTDVTAKKSFEMKIKELLHEHKINAEMKSTQTADSNNNHRYSV